MIELKARPCPQCRGEMSPQLINLVYTKEQSDVRIEVIGIPANVCRRCFYRILPGKVAKYIDSLVDPLFEAERHQQERILPAPHIGIQFPVVDKRAYAYSGA